MLRRLLKIVGAAFCATMACSIPLGCWSDPSAVGGPGDSGSFNLETQYTSLRSYRCGGGVFVIRMVPDDNFGGTVELGIVADEPLHAAVDRPVLGLSQLVAEITFCPDTAATIGIHHVTVTACHGDSTHELPLEVNLVPYSAADTTYPVVKRNEFLGWLAIEYPQYAAVLSQSWSTYATHPGILVVEHWTFLSETWEMRLCYHVTIPPYNWSMLMLRRRGEYDPVFAAKRESDGTLYEIPVSEYPYAHTYLGSSR